MLGWMRICLGNTYWEMLTVLVGELLEVLGLLGCIYKGLLRLHLVVDHLGMLLDKLKGLVDLLMEICFRVSESIVEMIKILGIWDLNVREGMGLLLVNLLRVFWIELEWVARSHMLLGRVVWKHLWLHLGMHENFLLCVHFVFPKLELVWY